MGCSFVCAEASGYPLEIGSALFPGRIDLGIAKGPGVTLSETASMLVGGNEWELRDDVFDRKAHDLVSLLHAAVPEPMSSIRTAAPKPWGVPPPPVWMLGSGTKSMKIAAGLGTPLAFALFFPGAESFGPEVTNEYRRTFESGPSLGSPRVAVAVSVICAGTEREAQRRNRDLVDRGFLASNVIGTPDKCRADLQGIAARFGADEILVTTWIDQQSERIELFGDLARVCELESLS